MASHNESCAQEVNISTTPKCNCFQLPPNLFWLLGLCGYSGSGHWQTPVMAI